MFFGIIGSCVLWGFIYLAPRSKSVTKNSLELKVRTKFPEFSLTFTNNSDFPIEVEADAPFCLMKLSDPEGNAVPYTNAGLRSYSPTRERRRMLRKTIEPGESFSPEGDIRSLFVLNREWYTLDLEYKFEEMNENNDTKIAVNNLKFFADDFRSPLRLPPSWTL